MNKRIFIIIFILIVFTIVASYSVYQYRSKMIKAQEINKQYEAYYEIEVLGTQLISIINKTIDLNEKNNVPKDDSGYYIEEQGQAVRVYVQFNYKDDVKVIPMENIASMGTEAFIKTYSTENFKCTKIEYYENTKNVKSVTFEEI